MATSNKTGSLVFGRFCNSKLPSEFTAAESMTFPKYEATTSRKVSGSIK
jgi:hypothetical protein